MRRRTKAIPYPAHRYITVANVQASIVLNVLTFSHSAAYVSSGTAIAEARAVSLKSEMNVLLSDGKMIRNVTGSVISRIRCHGISPRAFAASVYPTGTELTPALNTSVK